MKCRKTIIVLGCPRSGTSMIAGILRHLGVFMGENIKPGKHEDLEILWKPTAAIANVIHKRNRTQEVWGWKDPNSAKYIRQVLDMLVNPYFVYITRNPNKAVESELRRSKAIRQHIINRNDAFRSTYEWLVTRNHHIRVSYEGVVAMPECCVREIARYLDEPFTEEQMRAAAEFVQPGDYRAIS